MAGAVTTVIAEFTVLSIQIWSIRKEWRLTEILKPGIKNLIAGVAMFVVALGVGTVISNPVLSLATQMVTGAITYGIVLILLKDSFVTMILDKFK